MTTTAARESTELTVLRIDAVLPRPYDPAVRRFEELVPPADLARFGQLGSWEAVRELAEINAPHGLMIYGKIDVTGLMATSPSGWKCTEYLVGNHVIAQRMFHHDPAAMLHAPLRMVLYADAAGRTHLAVDRPSDLFASYGNSAITEVGHHLDGLVADLLDLLGAAAPHALRP
nr:GE004865 [Streptomyces sp.]